MHSFQGHELRVSSEKRRDRLGMALGRESPLVLRNFIVPNKFPFPDSDLCISGTEFRTSL